MDIFVISLKTSLDRRKEFDELNKNINYKYFDAIDGEITSKDSKILRPKILISDPILKEIIVPMPINHANAAEKIAVFCTIPKFIFSCDGISPSVCVTAAIGFLKSFFYWISIPPSKDPIPSFAFGKTFSKEDKLMPQFIPINEGLIHVDLKIFLFDPKKAS